MAGLGKRLRLGSAAFLASALCFDASPASAQSSFSVFAPDNLQLTGDVRLVAVDGEKSWVDGGFGKLRSSGGGADLRVQPQLGNLHLIWQPQFTWSLSATIIGTLQGGDRTEAGLSQAYFSFKPMRGSKLALSARAGLMFPPMSLEHEGADWHVRDSITPSAINSWIGEEVRPVAVEGTLAAGLGEHKLRVTAAIMAANDTSGTLLTFRGWALHDRLTLVGRRQPLPPLDDEVAGYQAPFTHPLLDIHHGFARRPGYYAKLAWQPPIPVRVELFRYDNRADPRDVNVDLEWGWRTEFDHLGAVAELGPATELKLQAMDGRTRMGFADGGRRWVDNRFRSAFVMLVQRIGRFGIAARAEAFGTRNRGSDIGDEYDDRGWSALLAAKREWGPVTGLVELLHLSSKREDREGVGLKPRQRQTQLQTSARIRW
jgi:hypothetical protein